MFAQRIMFVSHVLVVAGRSGCWRCRDFGVIFVNSLPLTLNNLTHFDFICVAASGRTQIRRCAGDIKLKVLGFKALDKNGKPASPKAQKCSLLTKMMKMMEGRCTDKSKCSWKEKELQLDNDKCPGVSSVAFNIKCKREYIFPRWMIL